MPTLRDFDVLQAARDALLATSQFDNVYLGGLPEDEQGSSAQDSNAAYLSVRDWDEPSEYSDFDGSSTSTRKVRYLLTLAVRRDDREQRDGELDRLLQTAANVLNGVSLAGLTFPEQTSLRRGRWEKPKPPERRMTVFGEFSYFIESDSSHGTHE